MTAPTAIRSHFSQPLILSSAIERLRVRRDIKATLKPTNAILVDWRWFAAVLRVFSPSHHRLLLPLCATRLAEAGFFGLFSLLLLRSVVVCSLCGAVAVVVVLVRASAQSGGCHNHDTTHEPLRVPRVFGLVYLIVCVGAGCCSYRRGCVACGGVVAHSAVVSLCARRRAHTHTHTRALGCRRIITLLSTLHDTSRIVVVVIVVDRVPTTLVRRA